MTKPEPPDVERLLKEALADDLPVHVERRLEQRFRSVLESRRRSEDRVLPIQPAFRRLGLGLISVVMVVAGLVLHAAGSRGASADSLLRLHASMALSRALAASTAAACPDPTGESLSPSAVSERVYHDWVLSRLEPSRDGEALVFLFRSGEGVVYEIRANRTSLRPEAIRKGGASGSSASCVWEAAASPR